jgi:hypothetical protein
MLKSASLLYGTSDPGANTGANDDFFINTTANTLFGPKASGAWPAGTSLVGPAGPVGATGPAGPAGTNGTNGTNGATGAAGADGKTVLSGTSNPIAGTGTDGDFYINTTANTLFGPKASGAWPAGTSLVGPAGTNGFLSAGSATGNTPYWNGTSWLLSSSNIYNNGTSVGIGTTSPTVKLEVAGGALFTASTQPLAIAATTNTVSQTFRYNTTSDVGYIGNGTAVTSVGGSSDFGIRAPLGNLVFATSTGLERMRITSAGSVGIGTTFPEKKLHVAGDIAVDGSFFIGTTSNPFSGNAPKFAILAPSGSDALNFKHLSNGSNSINVWQTGNDEHAAIAFFKGDTQSYKGAIRVSTTGVQTLSISDYRLKENVVPLKDGLSRLMQLKPVQYNWKINNTKDEGFLAHELQSVFPNAVSGNKDEVDDKGAIKPQAVDYGRITPLLVKAIQELQTTVEELKAKIKVLEEKK